MAEGVTGFASPPIAIDARDDILLDVVGPDGRIMWMNARQEAMLGVTRGGANGKSFEGYYTLDSHDILNNLVAAWGDRNVVRVTELALLGPGGRAIRTVSRSRFIEIGPTLCLCNIKLEAGRVGQQYGALREENELLKRILDGAREAYWCIEYLDPVDIAAPRQEIVQQIFGNRLIWRHCNLAMARLFGLPDNLDFHQQDVQAYWPRSEANELFAETIIESGYRVDGAISIDRRHDGSVLFTENDVRADLASDKLLRLWGTCRDVSERVAAERARAQELSTRRLLLATLPDAALLTGQDGSVVATNPLFDEIFGAMADRVGAIAQLGRVRKLREWRVAVLETASGRRAAFDVFTDRMTTESHEIWTVITLRRRRRAKRVSS